MISMKGVLVQEMNESYINFYVDKVLYVAFYLGPVAFVSMIFVFPVSAIVLKSHHLTVALFCMIVMSAILMFTYSVLVLKKIYSARNVKLLLVGVVYVILLHVFAGYFLYYRLEKEYEGISRRTFRL